MRRGREEKRWRERGERKGEKEGPGHAVKTQTLTNDSSSIAPI